MWWRDRRRRLAITLPLLVAYEALLGFLLGWHKLVHSAVVWAVVLPIVWIGIAIGRRGFPR